MSEITDPVITPPSNNTGSFGSVGDQWNEFHAQRFYSSGLQLATLASPAFTGNPTAPTQSAGNNTTRIATTAFVTDAVGTHTGNTSNPHSVTATQVGLGNADNTSDADKPVSTATQTALDAKASSASLSAHTGNTSNPHSVTASQVGLGNVANVDQTNASTVFSSGSVPLEYGGTELDLSAIPKGSIIVANAIGVLSVITSSTDGYVPTIQADGTIDFEAAPGADSYTDINAQDAVFGAITDTGSIALTYTPGSEAATIDVKLRDLGDLVSGGQGRITAGSDGLYVVLGTTSVSAARGDYGPDSGEKAALAGRGGTPSNANRYLLELFSALTAGTVASNTTLPGLLNGETEAKRFTVAALAALSDFRNFGTETELTIASGAVTFTVGFHSIDTQLSSSSSGGGDLTDDLDTISGLTEGQLAFFRAANGARTIVVQNGVDNIVTVTGSDITLDDAADLCLAIGLTGGNVLVAQLGAGGGGGGGNATGVEVDGGGVAKFVSGTISSGASTGAISWGTTYGSAPTFLAVVGAYQPNSETPVDVKIQPGSSTTTGCTVVAGSTSHTGINVIVQVLEP